MKVVLIIHLSGWFIYMLVMWHEELKRSDWHLPTPQRLLSETLIGGMWEFSVLPGVIAVVFNALVNAYRGEKGSWFVE